MLFEYFYLYFLSPNWPGSDAMNLIGVCCCHRLLSEFCTGHRASKWIFSWKADFLVPSAMWNPNPDPNLGICWAWVFFVSCYALHDLVPQLTPSFGMLSSYCSDDKKPEKARRLECFSWRLEQKLPDPCFPKHALQAFSWLVPSKGKLISDIRQKGGGCH